MHSWIIERWLKNYRVGIRNSRKQVGDSFDSQWKCSSKWNAIAPVINRHSLYVVDKCVWRISIRLASRIQYFLHPYQCFCRSPIILARLSCTLCHPASVFGNYLIFYINNDSESTHCCKQWHRKCEQKDYLGISYGLYKVNKFWQIAKYLYNDKFCFATVILGRHFIL